ncbi:MAG: sel1 repeat family protein [Gammaproteobacteria bacterium]|nr:sel1 repeat family protein [Gammaproteobacteria bacterium]TVQ49941.1 MAG: sel1 repeat family protein [Gammaproteobacteria bacterium]
MLLGCTTAGQGVSTPAGLSDDVVAAPGMTPEAEAAEARAHAALRATPPDWQAAREGFEIAAAAGSVAAMTQLGWIYEQGHGVPVDGEAAARWYAEAARRGAPEYALKLGWMYLGGQGVAQDVAQAEHWFQTAIEADYAPARLAWASVLIADAQGGVEPARVDEARTLLDAALADGETLATHFLVRLYREGIGGHPIDAARAADYAQIGAAHGHAQVQARLAYMYLEGEGVAQDALTAAKWANLAAAGGDASGDRLRRLLDDVLTEAERREVRARAVAWAVAQ